MASRCNDSECHSQPHAAHGWPSNVFTFVVDAVDTFQRPLSLTTVRCLDVQRKPVQE